MFPEANLGSSPSIWNCKLAIAAALVAILASPQFSAAQCLQAQCTSASLIGCVQKIVVRCSPKDLVISSEDPAQPNTGHCDLPTPVPAHQPTAAPMCLPVSLENPVADACS